MGKHVFIPAEYIINAESTLCSHDDQIFFRDNADLVTHANPEFFDILITIIAQKKRPH
jgi:hypothetical protein